MRSPTRPWPVRSLPWLPLLVCAAPILSSCGAGAAAPPTAPAASPAPPSSPAPEPETIVVAIASPRGTIRLAGQAGNPATPLAAEFQVDLPHLQAQHIRVQLHAESESATPRNPFMCLFEAGQIIADVAVRSDGAEQIVEADVTAGAPLSLLLTNRPYLESPNYPESIVWRYDIAITDVTGDTWEPNDYQLAARRAPTNAGVTGVLDGGRDEEDWFQFPLPPDRRLLAVLTNPYPDTPLALSLFDATEHLVSTQRVEPQSAGWLTFANPSNDLGSLFVRVHELDTHPLDTAAPYDLRGALLDPSQPAPQILTVTPSEMLAGVAGQAVTFTATLAGEILGLQWDFGAGALPRFSAAPSPQVTLASAGTHAGSLTIIGASGRPVVRDFTYDVVAAPAFASHYVGGRLGMVGEFFDRPAVITEFAGCPFWSLGRSATPPADGWELGYYLGPQHSINAFSEHLIADANRHLYAHLRHNYGGLALLVNTTYLPAPNEWDWGASYVPMPDLPTGPEPLYFVDLALIERNPILVWKVPALGEVHFVRAVGTWPGSYTWETHTLMGGDISDLSLEVVDGRPLVVMRVDGNVVLAHATTAEPGDSGDWEYLGLGPGVQPRSAAAPDDRVAVGYLDSTTGEIQLVRFNGGELLDATRWDYLATGHVVSSAALNAPDDALELAFHGDDLVVGYPSAGIDGLRLLRYRANATTPLELDLESEYPLVVVALESFTDRLHVLGEAEGSTGSMTYYQSPLGW